MFQSALAAKIERLGLPDKEALVYAFLVERGGAYPSKIAEETRLNRSTVYKLLLTLSVKGLVNEIEKRGKLFYSAERPDRLLRHVKSQISMATDQLERAQRLIPELEGIHSGVTDRAKVRYFEGTDGVVSVYEDHIGADRPYEMVAFANAARLEQFLPEAFFVRYRKTKERLGITTRGIIPDTDADRSFTDRRYQGFKTKVVPEMRFVPADRFPYEGEITVYGDSKVSIVNMGEHQITGLIIEDRMIHQMMRMIFELSWKGCEKKER